MKNMIASVGALCLLFSSATVPAEQGIPSLKGTWVVTSEGGIIVRGDKTGASTHWENNQTKLRAEAEVLTQDGRTLSGVFKSDKAQERFIGVIGRDNASVYIADEDGTLDGKIIDADTIETVYRHVKATDTVAALGVWRRKK